MALVLVALSPAAVAQQAVWDFDNNEWNLPGNVTSDTLVLSDVPAGGARIGDKVATLFELSLLEKSGDEVPVPGLDEFAIRGTLNDLGFLGIQVEFNGGVAVAPGESFSIELKFQIDADAPFQIVGVDLELDAFGVDPDASITIDETILDADTQAELASISATYDGINQDQLYDAGTFSAVSAITVEKVITVQATSGVVQGSRFTQTFRQVPEPGTLMLAAAGLAMVAGPRRWTRRRVKG